MRRTLLVALTAGLVFVSGTVQAAGVPDPGFGTAGAVVNGLLDQVGPVDVDGAGRSVVLGVKSDAIAIARYLADGTPDTSFSGDGRADLAIPVATVDLLDVRVLGDGSIVAIGSRRTDPNPFSNGLWSAKLTPSGGPAAGYGTNGVSIEDQFFTAFDPHGAIAADGSATILQGGIGGGFGYLISPTGSFGDFFPNFDTSAFPAGCVFMVPWSGYAVVRVSNSAVVHATLVTPFNCGLDDGVVAITRQTDAGAVVWTHVVDAPETAPIAAALAVQTKNLAFTLLPHRIRVNQVNPGWMDTENEHQVQVVEDGQPDDWLVAAEASRPLGRLIKPWEVANAIAFCLSPDSGAMTGASIDIEQAIHGAGAMEIPSLTAVPSPAE